MQKDSSLNSHWDAIVLGNGASALWTAHTLWKSKKTVLWMRSDDAMSSGRAFLQHAWLWGANPEMAQVLTTDQEAAEIIYFDAKNSKRFKKLSEAKPTWGEHEKEFFKEVFASYANPKVKMWNWHETLHGFYSEALASVAGKVEFFSEPKFVCLQNWPIEEIKVDNGKVTGIQIGNSETALLTADSFYLGDYDEYLPGFIKDEPTAEALAAQLKSRIYRPGFGLKLTHLNYNPTMDQSMVIPLIVNPGKNSHNSHVMGHFLKSDQGASSDSELVESFWIGFLTDEEAEDNNEILKKIKQTRRIIDKALHVVQPGFDASVKRESVVFEPKMRAFHFNSKAEYPNERHEILGCKLLTDHFGFEEALKQTFLNFTGVLHEGRPHTHLRGAESTA